MKKIIGVLLFIAMGNKLDAQAMPQQRTQDPALMEPFQIFMSLESNKTRTIGEPELIGKGIKQKLKNEWSALLIGYMTYIRREIEKKTVPAVYSASIDHIMKATAYLYKRVDELHNTYGRAFVIDPIGAIPTTVDIKRLARTSPILIVEKLSKVPQEHTGYLRLLERIKQDTMETIRTDTPHPSAWIANLKHDGRLMNSADIMPNYQYVLHTYLGLPQKDGGFFTGFLEQQDVVDEKSAEMFIDQLEKIAHIQEAKMRGFIRKIQREQRKKFLDTAKKLISNVRRLYPDATTTLDGQKLVSTTDKPSLILFLTASYTHAALSQLKRQAQILVDAAKKSRLYQRWEKFEAK